VEPHRVGSAARVNVAQHTAYGPRSKAQKIQIVGLRQEGLSGRDRVKAAPIVLEDTLMATIKLVVAIVPKVAHAICAAVPGPVWH